MNSEVFEKTSPTKLFFRCAVPSMISMAVGSLYSVADGIFVGQFIGENALAAVNLVMPLIMITFALSDMIAVGSSVQISIFLGQKEQEAACRTFTFSLKIILLVSILFGAAGFIFAKQIVGLLSSGANEQAVKGAVEYLKVYAAFAPLTTLFFATDNYLRICGKEKQSMLIGVVTQLLNIILDFILIVILKQGVWAAAFTSCITIALGSAITVFMFSQRKLDLYYLKGNITAKQFFKLILNGSSEFFNNIASSLIQLILNFCLLYYGGTTAVAAMSVVMYVDSIIGMLIFGMCDSLQPAISYCYGSGNIKKVKALEKRVLIGAMSLSLLALIFMRYAGGYVAPFFIKQGDTKLLDMSLNAMKLFSFSYLVGWVDTCLSSYFTALERPIRSFAVSILGTVFFPLVSLLVMSYLFGLNGIWLMPTLAGALSAIVTVILALTIKYNNN